MAAKYEINKDDANLLRQMCALSLGSPIPEKVEKRYWQYKRIFERAQQRIGIGDLARIAIDCGYGQATKKESAKPTIVDLWRDKKIEPNSDITVDWQGKKVAGKLLRVTASNECLVLLEGDPQERLLKYDCVTLSAAA